MNPFAFQSAAERYSLGRPHFHDLIVDRIREVLNTKYITNGYQARSGNHLELLRDGLRWDAPGDSMDCWYWAADDVDKELNTLINYKDGLR